MNAKEAKEKIEKINKKLKSTDKRFKNSISITNVYDNSFMFFNNGFAEKHDEWWFVFTEHHGFHLYCDDEIKIVQYKRIG